MAVDSIGIRSVGVAVRVRIEQQYRTTRQGIRPAIFPVAAERRTPNERRRRASPQLPITL
jgi:hypothetical protein